MGDWGSVMVKNGGKVIVKGILLFLSDLAALRGKVLISEIYFWLGS
jgi:hypothetical protein